jgi:hypothetical protein
MTNQAGPGIHTNLADHQRDPSRRPLVNSPGLPG